MDRERTGDALRHGGDSSWDAPSHDVAESDRDLAARCLDHIADFGVAILDAGGRIRYWNPGAEALFGLPGGAVLGRHASAIFGEAGEGSFLDRTLALARSQGRTRVDYHQFVEPMRRFWASVGVTFAPGDDGNDHFCLVFNDLTAQRTAQASVARQLAIQQTLTSVSARIVGAPELAVAVGEALSELGAAVDAEHACLFLLRDESQELECTHDWAAAGKSKRVTDKVVPLDRFPFWAEQLRTGEVLAADIERDGGVTTVLSLPIRLGDHLSGFLMFDEVRGIVGWTRSDLEMLEVAAKIIGSALEQDAARRSREELEAQLRRSHRLEAIGRLAGGVAHEFNNTLSVIINYARFLAEGIDKDSPLQADLDEIRTAGERAAELTRHLLVFSRKEVSRPRPISLNNVIERIDKLLQRTIGEHIDLRISLAPDTPNVMADPGQIETVLFNLALNSRDAMSGGGILNISTSIVDVNEAAGRTTGVIPGSYVRLLVRDTGCGMAPDVLARVFEPFFTTHERGKASGMGLATVYGIVSQASGHIRLDSTVGSGTTANILLPVTHRAATRALRRTTAIEPANKGRGETILLVEDEPGVRALTRRMLVRNGYTVLEADNGGEALRMIDGQRVAFDLLLSDLITPEMSGIELVARVRGMRPDVRVLYMSGYTEESLAELGIDGRGESVVRKPFTEAQLLGLVRAALA